MTLSRSKIKEFLFFKKWSFLVLRLKKFLHFLKKAFPIFCKTEPFLKKLRIVQEETFQARKIKKIHSKKISCISRNETF